MPPQDSQSKQLETVDIPGVEIFAEGTWKGDAYSHDDLQAMVDAMPLVGFEPTCKAGHADGQEDEEQARMVFGAPALGYVARLRVAGKKLLADLTQVPKRFAELIKAGAFKRISSEIYWDYKDDASGKIYPRVLKSVAFLGTDIPALTNLETIESLYQKSPTGALFAYDDRGNEFRSYCMEMPTSVGTNVFEYLLRFPRKAKSAVNYRQAEAGAQQRCANCKFFLSGLSACSLVEGYIDLGSVSDYFELRGDLVAQFNDDNRPHVYTIEKRGDEWCLISRSTGRVLGCHSSREKAEAQERAVQANKNNASGNGNWITVAQMESICPPCAERMKAKNFRAVDFKSAVELFQGDPDRICGNLWFNGTEAQRGVFGDGAEGRARDEKPPAAWWDDCQDKISSKMSARHKSRRYAMEIVEKDGQFCVTDGETVVKCYPTREEAEGHLSEVKEQAKGDAGERKYENDLRRLESERRAASDKAERLERELSSLRAEHDDTKGKESEALREVKKLKRERYDDQVQSWIAEQKRAGKLAPVEEPRIAGILHALYDDTHVVLFAREGNEVREQLANSIKAFVENRPSLFGELSVHDEKLGESLDDPREEVHRKTVEYMAKNGEKDYAQAMRGMLALRENRELAAKYTTHSA